MDGLQQHPRIIQVYLEKHTALRIDVTASTTFVDMVSNIGGILGLFTGMSILSAVEIIYFAVKAAASKVKAN